MSAKRILIITNRVPYPLHDGGNLAMHAMIEGYNKAGWQVYLLAMNTTRHHIEAGLLSKLYAHLYAFKAVEVDNSLKPAAVIKNYLFSNLPNHAARFTNAVFEAEINNVIRSFSPDVIQIESVFLSGYLPVIKNATVARTVLRLHNIESQVWARLANETKQIWKRRYLQNLAKRIRQYEERVWKDYDLLLPITNTDATVVKRSAGEGHIMTVPFGIDTDKIAPVLQPAHWIGYHIGAMDWLPNAEGIKWFLQQVWPLIYKEIPDFKFCFAGRNMPAYFSEFNNDGISCMGEVADAQQFIQDKQLLIVPLRSGGGIRVKILEAMAAGKLVISTTVGMQGIEAQQGKHFLVADDVKGFVDAIKWALSHKEEAFEIGRKASVLVQTQYDNAKLMAGLIQKLDNILANNRLR